MAAPDPVVIDRRYCGPRASANGGYAAGLFARAVEGPAEVTLTAPPRFATPIAFHETGGGAFSARAGGEEIARIRPGAPALDPPPLPDAEALDAARAAFLADEGMTMVYPYCFVCGKKRAEGDGLRIFAGAAPESPVNADRWAPSADLASDDGLVAPEFLWAALDCPSAFALRTAGAPVLLGRFTADIARRPTPGEALTVAAWRTGGEGRKHYAASALFDEAGALIAAANAVWIEIANPALLEKLRTENE